MLLMLLLLLVVLVLFGAGFALHVLWWVAIAALVLWVIGFFMRRACGETERDQYGQAGRGRGDGPGEPDRAADVIWLRGPPVPKFRADLGDAAVDVRAP